MRLTRSMRAVGLLATIVTALLVASAAPPAFSIGGLTRGSATVNTGIQYPWRFAYITDTHVSWIYGGSNPRTAYHLGKVIDTLNTIGVDFMVWGGDWSEDTFQDANTVNNVDSLNAIFTRANFPIWPVLGNHEAWRGDTAGVNGYDYVLEEETYGAQREPYYTAIRRSWVSGYFAGAHYHSQTWKNVRFVALQNNANYSIGSMDDYKVNNPSTVPAPNGITGYDFDGITQTGSVQRQFLRNVLGARDKSHWLIVAAHRPTYGTNEAAASRLNFHHNLRTTHFVKEVEDSLKADERSIFLWGDQHWNYITHAIRDSALAAATAKGGYHIMSNASGGTRDSDTTDVFPGAYQSYLFGDGGTTNVAKGTHAAWHNGLTSGTDPDANRSYTWQLFTVYGDHILVETFRTFGTVTSSAIRLGGKHRLLDRRTLSRDVSQAVPEEEPAALTPTPDPLSTEADAFVAYCDSVFTTSDEALIKGTFGLTPEFVAAGDWVYPSRNSASVAFETNLPCITRVEYGATSAYGSATTTTDRHYYHHLHHLTGLSPSTTYHYRLAATDDSGVTVYSSDRTLTTGAFASAIEIPGALSGPPYECSTTGATYILTQNLTVNGRGIFISANNVTVDLNGYTISYDNGTPSGSGLESSTSTSGVHFFRYNANSQGTLVRILNGTIKQGTNNGSGSVGVGFNPVAIWEGKVEVAGISAKYKGSDINGIHNQWGVLHAHHNLVHDGGTVTTNRSQGIKAIYADGLGNTAGEGIHHNTVRRARHQGIMVHSSDDGTAGVWDNEVWMDSYATNAYGIGPTTNVDHNKIFGTGYHVVGVGFLDHSGMQVTDNFIFLQGEEPTLRDDEYGLDSSVIGVRLTQYDGATFVYDGYLYSGNTIIVKGRDGTLSVRGTQLASSPYITNCRFINNVVKCEIQDAETRGACINAQGTNDALSLTEAQIIYEGNTLLTNDVFVRFGDQYACGGNHQLRENTLTKFGSMASYKAIRIGYFSWDSYGNRFIDNTIGSGVALSDVSVEGTPGGVRDYAVGHSLWIEARGTGGTPLASTVVTVYDNAGLSYTATTNGSGIVRLEMIEDFYAAGAGASSITHTTRSGHEIRTTGYAAHVVTGGEFAIENNEGSPLVVQFVL